MQTASGGHKQVMSEEEKKKGKGLGVRVCETATVCAKLTLAISRATLVGKIPRVRLLVVRARMSGGGGGGGFFKGSVVTGQPGGGGDSHACGSVKNSGRNRKSRKSIGAFCRAVVPALARVCDPPTRNLKKCCDARRV
jgi:hypothetical protein